MSSFVRFFDRIGMDDVRFVGGKNASLGEMIRRLRSRNIPVPMGYAVTAEGYWHFIVTNHLRAWIEQQLDGLNVDDQTDLAHRGHQIRRAIVSGILPDELWNEIWRAHRVLAKQSGKRLETFSVAVRSSATAEDLPGASFAGQQESFLNVCGEQELRTAICHCFASLFTDRAIAYRVENDFDHLKVALSVGVQTMVRSDRASAGVLFTIDTESGFEDVILINASYGLGESVVQGRVTPDQFIVFKPLLKKTYRPIIGRTLGIKAEKVVYGMQGRGTRTVPVVQRDRDRFCLTDDEILTLAKWGKEIESYYSVRAKQKRPMDIEWAKDGETGQLWIVQARPETVQSKKDRAVLETYRLDARSRVLVSGLAIGERIKSGNACVLTRLDQIDRFRDGCVLVTAMTDPDWVPLMRRASAIVTDNGGRTCHAAIVARELGLAAIVGTRMATQWLEQGKPVTVSCAEGEEGKVYEGILPYHVERTTLASVPETRTKIHLNLADPESAFETARLPNQGVGLMRLEFVFSHYVGIHPLALLHPDRVKDETARKEIRTRTRGYEDKASYMVQRLAEGIGRIAAAFYPKEVIVRASDFKTNEYAHLLGGTGFEPAEANPMIGWRGASRYYDPHYEEAFLLECAAFRMVREVMGLENLVVMIPFCRTPEEGDRVLKTMKKAGLVRGKKGLRVFVMIEIPSNVILAEAFAKRFDGFSIGSNDLTQLILGVDRDSGIVSQLYDEQHPAVLQAIAYVIRVAKTYQIPVGLCGQAPSDRPSFAEFLIREGITSISLNPDAVIKMTAAIHRMESKFKDQRMRKS